MEITAESIQWGKHVEVNVEINPASDFAGNNTLHVAIMERSASLDMIITLVVIVCVIVIFVIAVEAEVLAKIEVVVFEVVVPIVETEEAVIEVVAVADDVDNIWKIIELPIMAQKASTRSFSQKIIVGDGKMPYSQTTLVDVYGKKQFVHTDENEPTRR